MPLSRATVVYSHRLRSLEHRMRVLDICCDSVQVGRGEITRRELGLTELWSSALELVHRVPCGFSACPLGREPLHRPGVLGSSDGEGTAHQHHQHQGCLVQEAFQSRRDRGPCLRLSQPGGEQDEWGLG